MELRVLLFALAVVFLSLFVALLNTKPVDDDDDLTIL